MHALDQTMIGAIAGYLVLGSADLDPQFPGALFQPVARLHHRSVFCAKLRLHIGIHGVVGGGGGEHWILRGEGYLKHVRGLHRHHDQRILHCHQRGVARRIEPRADHVGGWRMLGGNQAAGDATPPGRWAQFMIEFGIGVKVQAGCDLLDHRHAL